MEKKKIKETTVPIAESPSISDYLRAIVGGESARISISNFIAIFGIGIYPFSITSANQVVVGENKPVYLTHNLNSDYIDIVLYDKDGYKFQTEPLMQKDPADVKNKIILWFSDDIDGAMTGFVKTII